ncbi:spore cortex biosynthesis protein YabQ [Geobacillus sp. G4]|uniref:Spore cortex biosynthesis protein YabQ n=7 Tax=Geobacillus TaxID=129337 RepID=A0A7U9J8M5_GEOTM|nr:MULTISPECIES: spore cortex biosynthesis protein YabQ [Geobacillus]ALA70440.1 spore coat protein [Geobacillus stearothermophilus 10]ADI25127.1 spore cortex biosynthesis protein YabQ [Geobacillus sp. C56-T3]ADU92569.1 spore cortex biosynthesis protein YabQ [Geobacillus sp. Y412MC52]AGE20670.1 putative spore protein [Geobacillus sp. GHH01]AMQ22037.1 spore cortex biosynthesis protein YabQ [Geobacillus sp. JS12]
MNVSIQLYTMLAMIGMGGWLGLAWDTYSRMLKRHERAHWLVFVNDVLFWAVQALIVFYVLLFVNEGELRFYLFLALLCGYAAYQSLLRSFYVRVLEWFIGLAVRLGQTLVQLFRLMVMRPLILLGQMALALLLFAWRLLLWIVRFVLLAVWKMIRLLLAPLRWTGIMIWRRVPPQRRAGVEKFFRRLKGFAGQIKNTKEKISMWFAKWRE